MFTRNLTSKSISKVINDLTYDTEKHYIGRSTFAFALKMQGLHPEYLLDPSYFAFGIYQSSSKVNASHPYGYSITRVPIEFEY